MPKDPQNHWHVLNLQIFGNLKELRNDPSKGSKRPRVNGHFGRQTQEE